MDRTERHKKKTDNGEVDVVSYFAEATCDLQVRLLDANDGRDLATFGLNQTGRSSSSDTAKSGMRGEAEDHAVDSAVGGRRLAVHAAQGPGEDRPRQEGSPRGRRPEARGRGRPRRGPAALGGRAQDERDERALRYNLGALCEALRDRRAARQYYEDAIRLNPAEAKYREALDALEARARDSKAMKKPG